MTATLPQLPDLPGWSPIEAAGVLGLLHADEAVRDAAVAAADGIEDADEVLDAILDELSASGVRRMPDVALVTDGGRVVVRGEGRVVLERDGQEHVVEPGGRGPWTDEDLGAGMRLVAVNGVPLAGSTGPVEIAGWPEPSVFTAGLPTAPDDVAATSTPQDPGAQELAPAQEGAPQDPGAQEAPQEQGAPQEQAEPVAEDVPPPPPAQVPLDGPPPPPAEAPAPAVAPPAPPAASASTPTADPQEQSEDEDLPSYDHLFGATGARPEMVDEQPVAVDGGSVAAAGGFDGGPAATANPTLMPVEEPELPFQPEPAPSEPVAPAPGGPGQAVPPPPFPGGFGALGQDPMAAGPGYPYETAPPHGAAPANEPGDLPPSAETEPEVPGLISVIPWAGEGGAPLPDAPNPPIADPGYVAQPHPWDPAATGAEQHPAAAAPDQYPAPGPYAGAPQPPPYGHEPAAGGQTDQPAGPVVLAVLCPAGHSSAPHASTCRTCGRDIAPQEPFETPRPPLGTLRLSTGDVVTLDRGVILGRSPKPAPDLPLHQRPHAVKLPSPDSDISRNHAELVLDGWHVLVRDLGSTNGTTVALPGQPPFRLSPGDQVPIEPGTVVVIAEQVSATYEIGP